MKVDKFIPYEHPDIEELQFDTTAVICVSGDGSNGDYDESNYDWN